MASRPDPQQPVIIQHPAATDQAGLAALLQFESDVRRRASVNELVYHVANETRRIVDYDQMFVLRRPLAGQGFHIIGASSISIVDRNAPLILAIEKAIAGMSADVGADALHDFSATAWSDDPSIADYPYHAWTWQPLADRSGSVFGGLLLARTEPLREAERVRVARVAETVSHAWDALAGGKPVRRLPVLDSKYRRLALIGLAIIAMFPVRLTALAPVEVVAARPFVVSAPYPGVIARMEVSPNALIKAGQPVLTFEDVKVRNELEQTTEKVAVAKARLERATSAAFTDADQAREIATLRAELDLALADNSYARDLMRKSQVLAPRNGMAIYSDRRDWEGRAVNTGDPIMQIADPRAIAYRVELPAKEQMTLAPGADVKVWLDAQPLWALNATVEQASYQARPTAEGVLAFAVTAKPDGDAPRIGSRGTAKLYGQWVPLAYSLFRRPIASVRQTLGL